jgi:hypothetical protein
VHNPLRTNSRASAIRKSRDCSFVDFYHRLRTRQAKENDLLVVSRRRKAKLPTTEIVPLAEVRCQQQLGVLLKHYYRKAA